MTSTRTASPARLLAQVAGERQTGALVVGGHPGGAVYLLEGRVIYAESPAAPGVGELLTSSGRLAARTWQNALDLGTSTARVGRQLVEQGHLTQGELELCVLGATYDAAYFALSPAEAPVEFLAGATHWLGTVVHIDPGAVNREVRRRVRLLDELYPDARVDEMPVAPSAKAPKGRIALTALQWEVLVHSDGQRTPADIAQLLGKAGFAVIQEVRRLASQNLLELPEVRRGHAAPVRSALDIPDFSVLPDSKTPGSKAPDSKAPDLMAPDSMAPDSKVPDESRALPRIPPSRSPFPGDALAFPAPDPPRQDHDAPSARDRDSRELDPREQGSQERVSRERGSRDRGLPPEDPPTQVPVVSGGVPVAVNPPGDPPRHSLSEDTGANQGVYRPPRLARRKPGAKLPKDLAAEPPPVHTGADEVLLKRIRTALRALR